MTPTAKLEYVRSPTCDPRPASSGRWIAVVLPLVLVPALGYAWGYWGIRTIATRFPSGYARETFEPIFITLPELLSTFVMIGVGTFVIVQVSRRRWRRRWLLAVALAFVVWFTFSMLTWVLAEDAFP